MVEAEHLVLPVAAGDEFWGAVGACLGSLGNGVLGFVTPHVCFGAQLMPVAVVGYFKGSWET